MVRLLLVLGSLKSDALAITPCDGATQPSCDPNTEGVKCSGPHETTQCIATTEGGIAKVLQEDVCTEMPNQVCVDGDNGVRCDQR